MALTNIKPLDPVQGFVDYILDIKPYHSKILEVLIEYIYTDPVNITIDEKLEWVIDMIQPLTAPIVSCNVGFDSIPYGSIIGETVLSIDPITDSFVIPGDRVNDFPNGSNIKVRSQIIDGITDTVIDPVGLHTGTYTIVSTTFTPGTALVDPSTTIVVSQDIIAPIPPTVAPNVYVVTLSHSPVPVIGIIPTNSAENAFFDIGSNMFVIAGNHVTRFQQGLVFDLDGGSNDGTYTVLYSDLVAGDTRIRVLEEITNVLDVSGQIKPLTVGFDYVPPICSSVPPTLLHVTFEEDLQISTELLLQEDVIAYDFENTAGIGFGHDPFGNVLPLSIGGQFGSDDYTIYHPRSQVSIDIVNNTFLLQGGHFSERFDPSLLISGYNETSITPGHLGDWKADTYNILSVDDILSTITIGNDLTWLFTSDRVFEVNLSTTNFQTFTVVNSTYDIVSNTTIIQTLFPPVLTSTAEVGVPHVNDLGVIYGAVYEPGEFNPSGEATTIVATSTPINPLTESVGYSRYGPLRINIGFNPLDSISNTIADAMALSNTMLIVPAIFDIFLTDAANDTFTIRYVDHNTSVPINVSNSFPVGSTFRVTGSFNNINDQEWIVQDISFNGTDTIITTVGNITNDTVPFGEAIREAAVAGAPAENLAQTAFLETLSMGWVIDSWFSYIILGVDQLTQEFTIAGNALVDVQPGMDIRIVSSPTNNGVYPVQTATFNGTDTIVGVTIPIPGAEYGGFLTPDESLGMVLDMKLSFTDLIGVATTEFTNGTSFGIFLTDAANDTFAIRYVDQSTGVPINISNSFPIGSTFRVSRSFNIINNKQWTVQNVIFDGTDTIITTIENITDDTGPFGNIIIEGAVLTEGGSLIGAFDYTYWDVGSYDESLGTTIYLYDNR